MGIRATFGVVIAAALALGAGGCAGSTIAVDEDLPADAVFLRAVDRSTDVSTVRVAYSASVAPQEGLGGYGVDVEGEVTTGPGVMTMTTSIDFGERSQTSEMRLVDGVLYTRVPSDDTGFGLDLGDVEWLALDLDGPDAEEYGSSVDPERFDFVATLEALRDVAEVTEDGRETIQDVPTTRYVGTATQRALAEAQGMSEQDAAGLSGDEALDEDVPVSIWIDDEGLVRRLDLGSDLGGHDMTTSMEVLAYGVDVDVVAPPADVTIDTAEYHRRLEEHMTTRFGDDFEGGEFEDGSIVIEESATLEAEVSPRAERTETGTVSD